MPVSGVDVTSNSTKPSTGEKARFIVESAALTGLTGCGINAAFAYFPKIDKDDFVKQGSKIGEITHKVADQTKLGDNAYVEEQLGQIFSGDEGPELVKVLKKANLKKGIKEGTALGLAFGLIMGACQIYVADRANKANKLE